MGSFDADVDDLSAHGLSLIVSPPQGSVVLAGDRLSRLRLTAGSATVYEGTAQVRRVTERADALALGVELERGAIDLDAIYALDTRSSFSERLQILHEGRAHAELSTEFKAWVADYRAYMDSLKRFLDTEEATLRSLDKWSREETILQYVREAQGPVVETLNAASTRLGDLVNGLDESAHRHHRRYYQDHILEYYLQSPFLRRAYEKPLGYAGDYEMMNMLYRDHVEGDSIFGKLINVYACQEPAARANINRIQFLGQAIRRVVDQRPSGRVQIASIGCGPAREIRSLLADYPEVGERLEIALIDQDERAIRFCERTLTPIANHTGARMHFIDESIRKLLTSQRIAETLGDQHLIYSAGLFDYLGDRAFRLLLSRLYEALIDGGELYIGNVNADAHRNRWTMEYGSDWYLNHRTPDELRELASDIAPRPKVREVTSEPTGVNLFLHMRK